MGTSITATKAPSCTGAFVVRGTAVGGDVLRLAVGGAMARPAAPFHGTGLTTGTALRLRPLGAEAGLRSRGYAAVVVDDDIQLNSDTPGDLPPRDPLS